MVSQTKRKTKMEHSTIPSNRLLPNVSLRLDQHLASTIWSTIDIELKHAPKLTSSALIRVYVLFMLGTISLIANVAIIIHLVKTRRLRRASNYTIYILLLHLSIADLLVTIFCMYGEAGWSLTVQWIAGEQACKLVKFFQMFALYLSTYILVLIGVDRWVAIKYPIRSLDMVKRIHRLLVLAYILSIIISLPQYHIFTVSRGPFIEEFYQCVTYGAYSAAWQEQLYTTFTLLFMYIFPLGILSITYASTFRTISDSEKTFQQIEAFRNQNDERNNRQRLINRAKAKSLKISVAIIAAFIICWTPYYVLMMIFMFTSTDEEFGNNLLSRIFFFGMSNSSINPIIYGWFSLSPHRKRRAKMRMRYNHNNSSIIRFASIQHSRNKKTSDIDVSILQ